MLEDNFEVLPKGTTEELRVLREFTHNVDAILSLSESKNIELDIRELFKNLNTWYKGHNEEYPL